MCPIPRDSPRGDSETYGCIPHVGNSGNFPHLHSQRGDAYPQDVWGNLLEMFYWGAVLPLSNDPARRVACGTNSWRAGTRSTPLPAWTITTGRWCPASWTLLLAPPGLR